MSLIADSLKMANKERGAPAAPRPHLNLIRPGQNPPRRKSSPFFRFFFLILLPSLLLAYLIHAGVFDSRRTKITELPFWGELIPVSKPGTAPPPVPAPPPEETVREAPQPAPPVEETAAPPSGRTLEPPLKTETPAEAET
ncbi:MAG: hypothetical protein GWM98_17835, partial [Nitrospinaceae bacterium]|nr:hypothetical protein [Nitrospinaceae bacterium]NIR56010.1 hypothetical protein [Nitrospinaceae bacterium]NIS86454.1 hypothetical protein [Nitrospinaceae bacterium]NIT83289.1 hypothetical protein [Nitrospinaceae bacterium]NIU45499.1 hypothetical protein [Nitrospinaceae bacterium]